MNDKNRSKHSIYSTILIFFILPLIIVIVAAIQPTIDPEQLFRDPLTAATHISPENCCPPYLGLISNIGVLLWCSAATVCFFLAFSIKREVKGKGHRFFFLSSGIISFIFMIDDFFLLHEKVYSKIFGFFGLGESYIMIIYGLLLLIYIAYYFDIILKAEPLLFFISMSFFLFAVIIDIFFPGGGLIQRLGEDGTKFLGISTWTGFILRRGFLFYMRAFEYKS